MTPLYSQRVSAALYENRAKFKQSQEKFADSLDRIQHVARSFEGLSLEDIEAKLAEIATPPARFGALPTREQDTHPFIVPFQRGRGWTHHRLARDWASEVLAGVTTFAADGSMIEPSADVSVPVGLVQIGWFENPHSVDLSYVKDVAIQIVSPEELEKADSPDVEINWLRYLGESARAVEFMKQYRGERAVVFMDGTMTISFVRNLSPDRQRQYRECSRELLLVSRETRVPAVGYIDSSKAIDLMTLLLSLSSGTKYGYDQVRALGVSDASLLASSEFRMEWGERSRTFICNRDDSVIGNEYYDDILFTYLQTTQSNPPARLEFPSWVLEDADYYEWVLDVVRAECIVGVGYPYPLETADAVAVLTGQDRERFLRLFQEFASNQGLSLRLSRKSVSKRGRRM
jgi:hypothetical protein